MYIDLGGQHDSYNRRIYMQASVLESYVYDVLYVQLSI